MFHLRIVCLTRALVGAFLLFVLVTEARGEDPLGKSLGLTPSTGSIPIWEKPDPQATSDLSAQVRNINPGIFLIGNPKNGYGTGFLISKQHRLVATNAHVADIAHASGEIMAIANESSKVFEIDRVWYHPGVVREQKGGARFRSRNPAHGDVVPRSPDVAVLHLAGTSELPEPLQLADRSEILEVLAVPVGMLGFPGHDTVSWPGVGENAQGTYRQGVIARATDFHNKASAEPADRQLLQHTMANWFGFSGSPIFLANGHVIAINNSGSSVKQGNANAALSFGIRIDCLWELLSYHHLDKQKEVPLTPSELRLARFEKEDPQLKEYQAVQDLIARAEVASINKKPMEALTLCAEAVDRMPNNSEAHAAKAMYHMGYAVDAWRSPDDAKAMGHMREYIKQFEYAVTHRQTAVQLDPSNISFLLSLAENLTHLKRAHDTAANRQYTENGNAKDVAEKVLALDGISQRLRGQAYRLRSYACKSAEESIPWLNKAIEVDPYSPGLWSTRANQYGALKEYASEGRDRSRSEQLDVARTHYLRAYKLARSSDDRIRNGSEALRLAVLACEATDYKYWAYLDVLAAAHAEMGDFSEAKRWEEKAVNLAPDDKKPLLVRDLRAYRDGKKTW
jgi:tetratricopeptide (TPR) repeat protein